MNSTVAVIGLGGVGLASVLGAKAIGAKVTCIDVSEDKLAFVRNNFSKGIKTINAKDADALEGLKFDYVFEMAGNLNALVMFCFLLVVFVDSFS